MSEHDEPKTALTRLLGEHGSFTTALGRVLGIDDWAWSCWCGHTEAWSPTDDVYRLHAAHLADVLLAEGYTTSPAPDATETVEWGISVDGHDPDEDDIFTDETLARQRVAPTARERLLRREVTHWRPV